MTFNLSEIQAILGDLPPQALPTEATSPSGRFGEWFARELGDVNTKLMQAEQGVQQLATGDVSNLHDVMIRLEEARLSFQLAVQIRNRVLEAYQDVMRMQV